MSQFFDLGTAANWIKKGRLCPAGCDLAFLFDLRQLAVMKPSLLIVDDEAEIRELIAFGLDTLDIDIVQAENGAIALEKTYERQFDAVISDLSMPVMGGLEFLKNFREQGSSTPFLILTGFGDRGDVIEALRHGVTDFLEKPFNPQFVSLRIQKLLEAGVMLREVEKKLEEFCGGLSLTPQDTERYLAVKDAILQLQKSQLLRPQVPGGSTASA